MSERDVVFNLKAASDPRAVQAAKDFESMLLGSQKKVLKSEEDFNKERVRIGKAAHDALLQFATNNREAILKDAELMKAGTIRIAQATSRELNRVDVAQAAAEKAERAKSQAEKARQQRAAEAKANEDARAALQKRLADFKAAKREEERVLRESLKRQADEERSSVRAETNTNRNQQKYKQAARDLREQFSELSESVMRVGRGITLLGLAGEKDLAKLQEGMLKAQAAMDIFSGGLKVINKLERAWSSYVVMIESANAAMAVHNSLSAIGGAAGLARGVGAGAIRTTATTATGRAVSAGAGAVAGAGILTLLSRINPLALLGRAPAAVTNLVNVGGRVGAVDAVAGGAGARGALGHMAARIGFSNMASGGASVSAGLMGARAIPVAGQMIGAGMAGYSVGNALSGAIGVKSLAELLGRNFGANNYKETTRAEKGSQFISARNERIDALMSTALSERSEAKSGLDSLTSSAASNQIAAAKSTLDVSNKTLEVESKIAAIRNRMNTATTASAKVYLASQLAAQEVLLNQLASTKAIADDAAKISVINAQRAQEEQRIYSLRKQMSTLGDEDKALRDSLRGEVTNTANKLIELTQRRGEIEKNIADTKAASARSALDSARKELETVTGRIKSEKDALLTAEERFGMMSRKDQTEVMQLLQKARAGTQLDAGQISKLKSLGTTEAERLGSAQARNLANGDYSKESRTLSLIEESNRRLRSRVLDVTEGKTNQYGVNPGAPRMLSRRQKQEVEATNYQIEVNERRAEQIRLAAANDTAMRRSIFGEERGRLAQSLNQKQSIEARISQQLTVVARFDNTAKQVADMAVRQLMEAQAPWISEFERRLKETMTSVGQLQNQRRQMAPGR